MRHLLRDLQEAVSGAVPSIEDIAAALRHFNTKIAGSITKVEVYDWGVVGSPQGRQRLDHYGNDGQGWDDEGWYAEYAGPLTKEIEDRLVWKFDDDILKSYSVDVGEKGHVSIQRIKKVHKQHESVELQEKWGKPAKEGEKRKWARGEMQKTKDGWIRVSTGRPGSKRPAPTTTKSGKPQPDTGGAKPAAATTGTAKPTAASTAQDAKPAAAKPKAQTSKPPKDKPAGDPEAPVDPQSEIDASLDDGRSDQERADIDKNKKQIGDKLNKHRGNFITRAVKGVWNKFKGNWKKTEFRQAATTNFMSKLGAETGETVQATWTLAKMILPGVHTTPDERKDMMRQVFDIAKGAMLVAGAPALGAVGVAATVAGLSPGKVFDALLDKPLRIATKIAFGEESGILPSAFYVGMNSAESLMRDNQPKEKKPKAEPKKPKKPKEEPQTEWVVDGKAEGELQPGEDIDQEQLVQGAQEQSLEYLQQIFEKIMDTMATAEPEDDDISEAFAAAGLDPKDVDELIKWHDHVEVPDKVKGKAPPAKEVPEFKRLAGLPLNEG